MKTVVMKWVFASIKVVNKTVYPMWKFTKINKIILRLFTFLLRGMLGTVELTVEATGLGSGLLCPAGLRAHGDSQTHVCPSPADAPVILGRKEADCTGMADKKV